MRVQDKVVMQEPAVRVQDRHLILASFDNVRMAVTNMADVVDAVQELLVLLVIHILTFGPDNLDRIRLEKKLTRRTDMFLSQRNSFISWNLFLKKLISINNHQMWVGNGDEGRRTKMGWRAGVTPKFLGWVGKKTFIYIYMN